MWLVKNDLYNRVVKVCRTRQEAEQYLESLKNNGFEYKYGFVLESKPMNLEKFLNK